VPSRTAARSRYRSPPVSGFAAAGESSTAARSRLDGRLRRGWVDGRAGGATGASLGGVPRATKPGSMNSVEMKRKYERSTSVVGRNCTIMMARPAPRRTGVHGARGRRRKSTAAGVSFGTAEGRRGATDGRW
jgi:hypothetical protein